MVQEILKDIYRIQVPLPGNPLQELNAYYLKGDGRSLLIDTGFAQPECRDALSEGLRKLGAKRENLDVFGTHIHSDHIGLAAEFVGEGRSIYIGEYDWPLIDSAQSNYFWKKIDQRFLKEGFPKEELDTLVRSNPARTLGPPLDLPSYRMVRDGDILHVGQYTLKVIHTPGHTPGQVCLWMEKEGVMFTADHVLFDITPNIAMWPNMDNALGRYLDSLRQVREYPVKLALPGHRHSDNFHARIDQLLEHHKFRVGETLSIVQDRPGMVAYEIAGRMTWKIRARSWGDFPLIQKWFAVGECIAHLDLLLEEGSIQRYAGEDGLNRYRPASNYN